MLLKPVIHETVINLVDACQLIEIKNEVHRSLGRYSANCIKRHGVFAFLINVRGIL